MKIMQKVMNAIFLAILVLFLAGCGGGGPGGSISGTGGSPLPGTGTGTGSAPGPSSGPGINSEVDSLIQTAIQDDNFEPNNAQRDCVNALENATNAQIRTCIDNN